MTKLIMILFPFISIYLKKIFVPVIPINLIYLTLETFWMLENFRSLNFGTLLYSKNMKGIAEEKLSSHSDELLGC